MNFGDAKVEADVKSHGWHVVLVAGSNQSPCVAYTVGLFHNYQHPEFVVLGLPDTKGHEVLNIIGAAVKNGAHFCAGDRSDSILLGHSSAFVDFPNVGYFRYLGYARRFYGAKDFPVLQFVWPDAEGKFPWDAGVAADVRANQAVTA